MDVRDPRTWKTQARLRRELEIEASDAEWNGDTDKADRIRFTLSLLDPKLDHELVVPF